MPLGSWYSQLPPFGWFDPQDRPGSSALGVPDSQQGIALPSRAGLGKWFNVTPPGASQPFPLQQTDVGPAPYTGRGVDISAAGAHQMGYNPKNFPTDANFKVEPIDLTGLGLAAKWNGGVPGQNDTAVAEGPPQQGRKKMPNSLMDMFQPQDAAGQPVGFGDAVTGRSNSLIGLGLGLLSPSNPLRGQSGWSQAMEGYMGGAALDARQATSKAALAHQKTQEARQAAMDQFTRAEAVRNQQNLDRAYEGGRVPPGFERGPDGGLRATTGGPADPKYLEQVAQGKQKPREFSVTDITKLTEEGGKLARLGTFGDTFEPRFAGYKAGLIGDAANLAGRNLPEGVVGKDIAEGATWWQGYNDYKNVVRHDLYGGALTPTEVKVFESANITPGMDPAQIQKNLAMQKEVVQNGLRRKANALIASGYDPKAIAQAYGVNLGELGVTASGRGGAVTPGATSAPSTSAPATAPKVEQQRTINGKSYSKIGGQWYED